MCQIQLFRLSKKIFLGPIVIIGCVLCSTLVAIVLLIAVPSSIIFSYIDCWFYNKKVELFPSKPKIVDWINPDAYTPKESKLAKYFPRTMRVFNGIKHLLYMIFNQTLQNRRSFRPNQ